MKSKLFLTFLTLILATISRPSMAWKWEPVIVADEKLYRWPDGKYSAVADSRYFPPLTEGHKPIERLSLFNAMTKLNKLPSKIFYDVSFKTFNPNIDGKFNNKKNEIWFSTPKQIEELTNVLGYTDTQKNFTTDPVTYTEADVVFNQNHLAKFEFMQKKESLHIWKTDSEGQYSFMHVAMHELGHAAGALHEGDIQNLMGLGHGGKRPYETISGYHVPGAMGRDIQKGVNMKLAIPLTGSDFTNGITTVYGIDPAKREDVSISPWKWNKKEPDCVPTPTHQCKLILYYSLHSRKDFLYDSGGNQLTPIGSSIDPGYKRSDPVYQITKGNTYQAAFSFENTGKSPSLDLFQQ